MNTPYTRQALPAEDYLKLLGTALCVFNANNNFIIENILHADKEEKKKDWYSLIDLESGYLIKHARQTITKYSTIEIVDLFVEIVSMRNRIVHSFQVTYEGEQILFTKEKNSNGELHKQYPITKKYLVEFIKKNESLSLMLHMLRKNIQKC